MKTMRLSGPPVPGAGGSTPAPPRPPAAPLDNPLMGPMYAACGDLLLFLASLVTVAGNLRSADGVRETVHAMFQRMGQAAQASGIAEADVAEARYALVALLDEQLLAFAWEGRMEWYARPLQLLYFNENTAGDGFFHRLYALTQQPHRAHVTQIYALCLALGFQGRYATLRGEGLGQVIDYVAACLDPCLPPSDVLAPRALPEDLGKGFLRREAPLVRLGLAVFGAALLVFLGLEAVLSFGVSSVVGPMEEFARHTAPAAEKPRR